MLSYGRQFSLLCPIISQSKQKIFKKPKEMKYTEELNYFSWCTLGSYFLGPHPMDQVDGTCFCEWASENENVKEGHQLDNGRPKRQIRIWHWEKSYPPLLVNREDATGPLIIVSCGCEQSGLFAWSLVPCLEVLNQTGEMEKKKELPFEWGSKSAFLHTRSSRHVEPMENGE